MDYAIDLIKGNLSKSNNEVVFSNQLIYKFIDYTDVQDTTLKNYTTDLKPFFNYLRDNDIKQPNRQDIKNFKKYLII